MCQQDSTLQFSRRTCAWDLRSFTVYLFLFLHLAGLLMPLKNIPYDKLVLHLHLQMTVTQRGFTPNL